MFEYVIIGGGIAGLYAYDKLLEQGYRNIILLEANNYVGGRIGIDMWYGARLSIGAGIGRKNKDILLQRLCKKHGIELKEFEVNKDVSEDMMTETELRNTVAILKREYNERYHKELTFRQYGMEVLGAAQYQKFIKTYEYTDMEKADTYETLNYYGFDDGYNGWTGLSVPWDELLDKMAQGKRIKLNEAVIKITCQETNILEVETERHIYKTAKVVIATTVDTVRALLGRRQIYRQVEGQPFMRIYGKFGRETAELMHSLVPRSKIVGNQIKRIIPMSEDVYMIVYSDNASATYMEKHVTGNDKESREFLSEKLRRGLLTQEPLPLTAIKKYYWHIGTHYMRPFMEGENYTTWIKEAQNPTCNIFVVGEAFSRNQGWVEGALESVEAVFG
jgi:hypothetical protein